MTGTTLLEKFEFSEATGCRDFWYGLEQEFAFAGVDNSEFEQTLRHATEIWMSCTADLMGDLMGDGGDSVITSGQVPAWTTAQDSGRIQPLATAQSQPEPILTVLESDLARYARMEVAIATAWKMVQTHLQRLLNAPKTNVYRTMMLGSIVSLDARDTLERLIDEEDWPDLALISFSALKAKATYVSEVDTIYLAQEFIVEHLATPEAIARVLLQALCECLGERHQQMDMLEFSLAL